MNRSLQRRVTSDQYKRLSYQDSCHDEVQYQNGDEGFHELTVQLGAEVAWLLECLNHKDFIIELQKEQIHQQNYGHQRKDAVQTQTNAEDCQNVGISLFYRESLISVDVHVCTFDLLVIWLFVK